MTGPLISDDGLCTYQGFHQQSSDIINNRYLVIISEGSDLYKGRNP